MNKALLTIIALAATGFAQPKWTWQNPLPQGNYLTSVWSIDSMRTMAVGYVGTVIATEDGGVSWQFSSMNDGFNIYDLVFTVDNVGWCVGVEGGVYRTEDFGKSWTRKNSDSSSILHSIFFLDSHHGWIVGYNGLVLKTSDGGNSWESHTYGSDQFLSVYFINQSIGWIAAKTQILKTTDGGTTWTKVVDAAPTISSKSTAFVDSLHGWVVCENGRLMQTMNGGVSWTSLILDSTVTLSSIHYVDKTTGWLSGSKLFKTTDAGETWIGINDTVFASAKTVHFINSANGWVVGDKGLLMKTTDGGQTWTSESQGTTNWIYDIDFVSEQIGWAVGTSVVLRTTNGGNHWEPTSMPAVAIRGVDFVDEKNGWIVGSNGFIEYSTDGGINWLVQKSPRGLWLNAVHFFNSLRGIAVGDSGVIIGTTNGGSSWTSIESQTKNQLTSMSFVNDSVGWICGYDGLVLKTTNGGALWQSSKVSGMSFTLPLCIQFVDPMHGWVSDGINQKFYRTTDGGVTWVSTTSHYLPNDIFNAESFFFFDTLNGIAGGFIGGTLFRTTDGGITWGVERRVILNRITAFHFVTPKCGWLVGRDGSILKYDGSTTDVPKRFSGGDSKSNAVLPEEVELYQNFPNPFNPSTKITFRLAKTTEVNITVYDGVGRKIALLVNQTLPGGSYKFDFSASDLANGAYFYRIKAGNYLLTRKMVLLK